MSASAIKPGLIVVDSSLNLVASNPEAIQILSFPEPATKIRYTDVWTKCHIRSQLFERQERSAVGFTGVFQSARRTYLCRYFPLDMAKSLGNGHSNSTGLLIVLLERKGSESATVAEAADRFGLTAREQETVHLLLQGLTSKEIAQRMKISPNTVKAFLRLVMVKMSVSTRSGIIGKIVGPSM